MSANVYLALLFICVIIGLIGGFYVALWIGSLGDGVAYAFGGGLGTILVVFGCCTAGVIIMYTLAAQIDRLAHRRGRAEMLEERKERKQKKRARKKRRKKR